ncbi:MAG: hypothetical protein ACTHLT_03550 [Devosia sp.]
MIRIRPLAGAVLTTLLLTSVGLADSQGIINLTPPPIDGTGPTDTRPVDRPSATADSGTSYSAAEFDDGRPSLQTRHFGGSSLSCEVAAGATDLVVVNQSADPLPPGTRIKWQLKNERTRGFFAIVGELRGGESLVAGNVLDGQAAPDDVCVARVI